MDNKDLDLKTIVIDFLNDVKLQLNVELDSNAKFVFTVDDFDFESKMPDDKELCERLGKDLIECAVADRFFGTNPESDEYVLVTFKIVDGDFTYETSHVYNSLRLLSLPKFLDKFSSDAEESYVAFKTKTFKGVTLEKSAKA